MTTKPGGGQKTVDIKFQQNLVRKSFYDFLTFPLRNIESASQLMQNNFIVILIFSKDSKGFQNSLCIDITVFAWFHFRKSVTAVPIHPGMKMKEDKNHSEHIKIPKILNLTEKFKKKILSMF